MKHGERSRRAFFPLGVAGAGLSPLVAIRVRNLLLVDRLGEINQCYGFGIEFEGGEIGREAALISGILGQHLDRSIRYEKQSAKDALEMAKADLTLAKAEHRQALAEYKRLKMTSKS